MKTTINLKDDVVRRLKSRAALRGQSLSKFMEESLEQKLAQDESSGDSVAEWIETLPIIPKSVAKEVEEMLADAPFSRPLRMILDTNAISALSFRDEGLLALLKSAPRIALPFVCVAEYRFGISGSSKKAELNRFLDNLIGKWPILFPDDRTLRIYAEICAQLKTAGTAIPSNEIWIAALTRQEKLPLVSRDQHFDKIGQIYRVSW